MMVYLIDSTAPAAPRLTTPAGLRADPGTFAGNWERRIRQLPGHESAQLLVAEPSETVADLTRRVIAAVGQRHVIWMLRIVAHRCSVAWNWAAGWARPRPAGSPHSARTFR